MSRLQVALGPERLAKAWAQGRAMSLKEAVDGKGPDEPGTSPAAYPTEYALAAEQT